MWHYALRRSALTARAALALSLLGTSTVAQTITFRKIADTNTPIPGGTGTFTHFSSWPVIDRGNVVFEGQGTGGLHGLFTDLGGALRVVATTDTVGPGGTGKFTSAFEPSIDDGMVAFRGRVALEDRTLVSYGVYLETSGSIVAVAVNGTASPGGGVFNFFESNARARPSVDAGNVAFAARTSDAGFGIFIYSGGTLSTVVDSNTPIPGGSTLFSFLGNPYLSGDNVAFFGQEISGGPNLRGVFARIDGVLQVVADNSMTPPGGTTTFFGPTSPVMDGEDIAFFDLGSDPAAADPQQGIYTYYDGVLASGNMGGHTKSSIENRALVVTQGPGIIATNMGGSAFRVIGRNDILDGKTLSLVYQSHEAISGNEIVFFAFFDDDSRGIYVARIMLFCGNQVVDDGEDCDDGGGSAVCDADCSFPACGDDMLNTFASEECDDGVNNSDTIPDACRLDCTLAHCGDGVIDSAETCDDGNTIDGDGCSDTCQVGAIFIPTVSVWGLVGLGLLLCVGARLRFGRAT